MDLQAYLKSRQQTINTTLSGLLRGDSNQDTRIMQAMQYSLMAGGKRLRPILAIAVVEALRGDVAAVLPAACAIEMIHTYSLVHDDLPAMDNDNLRRGQPTAHVRFDEATAILAGDALLTRAFEIIATPLDETPTNPERQLRVIQTLAKAAGYQGMIQGQMLDMGSEGQRLDFEKLKTLHNLKTGALIEASVLIGALFTNADKKALTALHSYANHIGLAFQVVDDILNISGDPGRLGKAVGTDNAKGKNTFPGLLGLEKTRRYAQDLIQNALNALIIFDKHADPLRAIARYITERDH